MSCHDLHWTDAEWQRVSFHMPRAEPVPACWHLLDSTSHTAALGPPAAVQPELNSSQLRSRPGGVVVQTKNFNKRA